MRKASLIGVALASVVLGSAGDAAIQVVGGSIGYDCYVSATTKNGSQQALRQCDDALSFGQLSPRDTVATYVNRGVVRIYGRDYESAIEDFDQAIRLDPNEPESYLNKGSAILRMQGNPAEAVTLFDEALARKTRRPEIAHYARAVAHETSGNLNAAYRDYRRAQELAPRWQDPGRELSRFQVRRASSPQ